MKIKLQNVNTGKLHQELINGGIIPELVESRDGITWITIDSTLEENVMAIVAIHDTAPLPSEPTEISYLLDLDFRLSMIELGL